MNAQFPTPLRRLAALASMLIAVLVTGLVPFAATAAPLAGTPIGNTATATYSDANNITRTVPSNLVVTYVQQVAGFTLVADRTQPGAPGTQVVFSHVITNTGNGPDSLSLSLVNLLGDDFNLSGLAIYVDADGNNVPDNLTPITSTGAIAPGATFHFVVVGDVPGTATGGQFGQVRITATSAFDPLQTAFNTDRVDVSGNAVILMSKAVSQPSGPSPSGPYTYTITYRNTGNTTAKGVRVTDLVPAGMAYVANSGRWSVTGVTTLTDADSADWQSSGLDSVRFNYNVSQAGGVSAVFNRIAPGVSATLSFDVTVSPNVPPQTIDNVSRWAYFDGAVNAGPYFTNPAPFTVTQTAALTFTGQTIASALQGSTLTFTNTLTNNGNGTDTYNVVWGGGTFPVGTVFNLLQSNGINPLQDTNGDTVPDTGPLAPGASYTVVLQVSLPPTATGGPYQVQKTATSVSNPAVSATATDVLTAILANSVDLTNNAPLPAGLGAGPGPEPSFVVRDTLSPAGTVRFTLHVNNTSAQSDVYNMTASTDPAFASLTLPAGWTVMFRDAGNTPIAAPFSVAAGGNALVYADVSVPAGYPAGDVGMYFRTLSPNTGASDRIHDEVGVNAVRRLTLVPNGTNQVTPGGFAMYTHILANTGNVTEGNGVGSFVGIAAANDQAGWGTTIYWDTNGSGSFDVGDTTITDLGAIGGLAPGTSVRLFVKVSAPAGAPFGQVNVTTLSATTSNVGYTDPAPGVAQATDVTTVINGQLQLTKRQALDVACDGTADSVFTTANLAAGALPGRCLRYEITVTNVGTTSVTNAVVTDTTPSGTTYSATVPAATSQGTITTVPADGTSGNVIATIGTIAPGASVVVTFGVRINP